MTQWWEDDELVESRDCCDGWSSYGRDIKGLCPDCEGPILADGSAAAGCYYSPLRCEVCGSRPCDQSC